MDRGEGRRRTGERGEGTEDGGERRGGERIHNQIKTKLMERLNPLQQRIIKLLQNWKKTKEDHSMKLMVFTDFLIG